MSCSQNARTSLPNDQRTAKPPGRIRLRGATWPACIVCVGCLAFAVAMTVTFVCPYAPRVHDEFSYLLAADTLLHGRLANPTPDVWQPFQSFHIILEPSYASKYPLGPGMIIALGWLAFGAPIAGSWLSAGLCSSCITWMLAGVTSRRWALFGGLLIAVHPAMQVSWSQSLMNGWLTAAAGALVTGAVLRLRRYRIGPEENTPRLWFLASMLGLGIAGFALTRPFEGLVATLLSGLLLWVLWNVDTLSQRLHRSFKVAAMALPPVALALGVIACQNYATSNSILRMPYQLHEQKYGVAPLFVFGQEKQAGMEQAGELPEVLHDYHHGWSLESFQRRAGWQGFLIGTVQACQTLFSYWVALAWVPLLTVPYWLPMRVSRWLATIVGLQLLASSSVCWIFPHYLSPVLPWITVLAVLGFRRLVRVFRRSFTTPADLAGCQLSKRWTSTRFCAAILSAQCVLLAIAAVRLPASPQRTWAVQRAQLNSQLEEMDGSHLVLVRYAADHNVHQEWVYNRANLDTAKVLWARDERAEWNQRLLKQYASNRYVWQLEPDQSSPTPKLISAPVRQ